MPGKIERAKRFSVRSEVRGGGAEVTLVGGKTHHHQRRIFQLAYVDDQIPVAIIGDDGAIGQREAHKH